MELLAGKGCAVLGRFSGKSCRSELAREERKDTTGYLIALRNR